MFGGSFTTVWPTTYDLPLYYAGNYGNWVRISGIKSTVDPPRLQRSWFLVSTDCCCFSFSCNSSSILQTYTSVSSSIITTSTELNRSTTNSLTSTFIMVCNVFLFITVLVCIVSIAHSFHASSNRIQKASLGTKHPTSLLMSKASQEKADEKKMWLN